MPRSCSFSDMAGTAMLYQPGTDGAAVTDVRLHGGRPSQHPESRNTRTHWIWGFMTFLLARRTRIVILMVPVCPESGFLAHAAEPRSTSQRHGLQRHECGSTPYPMVLASLGCGTDGAVTHACDG